MSEYQKQYGTVNTDAEREELLADKVAKRLSGQMAGVAGDAARQAVSGLNIESMLEKVAGKLATADERAAAPVDADAGVFKVTGPGYTEQFTSRRLALKAYEALKNRMRKNEQAATVRLSVQAAGSTKWAVEQELKLNEDHY